MTYRVDYIDGQEGDLRLEELLNVIDVEGRRVISVIFRGYTEDGTATYTVVSTRKWLPFL
jgi:hypothetical protein